MFRKFRKAVGCIIAAAVMTVVSVTASADYIYDLNNTDLLDEIKATDYEIYHGGQIHCDPRRQHRGKVCFPALQAVQRVP